MSHRIFCHHWSPASEGASWNAFVPCYWFRILGYGLHFRWVNAGYVPLFSERNGYTTVLKIGRLWIKGLKP